MLIHLDHVSKKYPVSGGSLCAIEDLSLSVEKGEFLAITGQSGCGKSTLMNILGCLDKPSSGDYLLDGISVLTLSDHQLTALRGKKLGFIFQSYNLIPTLTCLENVELPLLYAGLPTHLRRKRVMNALDQVGLSQRASHRPFQLSGGQQQKTAIARAIAMEPQCFLADEPTGNLDPQSTKDILELLFRLNRQGKTIILITHDPAVAAAVPRVVHIDGGRIVTDRIQHLPRAN